MKKVGEIFLDLKKENDQLLFIFKIEKIQNIEIKNYKEFKKIIKEIVFYIKNNYKKNNIYKIVLVTSKLTKNKNSFLISFTFVKTNKINNQKKFLLKESVTNNKIDSANSLIKKRFDGKIKITFYKNKGRVITCYFNLK